MCQISHNRLLLSLYWIKIHVPITKDGFPGKLEMVFIKHYAPNISLSPNMAKLQCRNSTKKLDFAQKFYR